MTALTRRQLLIGATASTAALVAGVSVLPSDHDRIRALLQAKMDAVLKKQIRQVWSQGTQPNNGEGLFALLEESGYSV